MDIKILDTGYGTATGSLGTKSPVASRAGLNFAQNAANSFTLQAKDITLNGGGLIQDETEIRVDDSLSSSSVVSHTNPTIVIPCSISVSDIPSDFDRGWLWQLIRLERTKSVKVLYLTAASGRLPEIIELYGQGYKGGALASEVGGATIPYIPGYVSISNLRRSAKTDELNFQVTFKTI